MHLIHAHILCERGKRIMYIFHPGWMIYSTWLSPSCTHSILWLLSWCLPHTGLVIQTSCCGELVSSKVHYVTCNAEPYLTQKNYASKGEIKTNTPINCTSKLFIFHFVHNVNRTTSCFYSSIGELLKSIIC